MSSTVSFPGSVFPFGTHVYREPPADMDELLADLALLKKFGFNMIKIQEHWGVDEPREGEYDFSRIERVIARARQLGLGVYLGLTMEQAPAWMWKKFPDCRLVYASGLPHNDPTQYTLPADAKPGPCWDHPGARAAAERFVAELARRLGRFENIWAWNTWQEIGFWPNDGGPLGFCYCPHTLARFREWLKDKYGSLEALNRAWRSAYGEWEEIEPPRRSASCPPFIDWRRFMDSVYITRALEWKTRALRENDPRGRPVFSHVGAPRLGAASEWRWARAGDFFGCSYYPAWGSVPPWDDGYGRRTEKGVSAPYEIWNYIQLHTDYCRSAVGLERTFWAAEFQGGPVSTHLHKGRTPGAEDVRRWMLAVLAAGANGISFWNHRCERFWAECNGFGLLDPRGESTERIEEAARIARAVNEDAELFALGKPPKAQAAMLVSDELFHFCQATGNAACEHLQHAIRGNYARLWRMGVWVDFLDEDEVAAGALEGYRAAILPFPIALDGEYFARLSEYVKNGGTLVVEACPGRFDKFGFCPRAQMVAGGEELFGARHKDVRIVREPNGETRWTPEERTFGEFAPPTVLEGTGEFAGVELRAAFYLQTFEPRSARPILLAGADVAGTINEFGKGRAILLGTFAGHSALSHVPAGPDGFGERLAETAGLEPDRCGALLRRRRLLGDRQAWFLINAGPEHVEETIDLEGMELVRDLLGDAVVRRSNSEVTVKVGAANVSCLVLRGAWLPSARDASVGPR